MSLFTSQSASKFYNKLFSTLEFTLEPKKTGRIGFTREAILCTFIAMKCQQLERVTDLLDHLENDLLIAHYCGFDITRPLPPYWAFARFLKQPDSGERKEVRTQ